MKINMQEPAILIPTFGQGELDSNYILWILLIYAGMVAIYYLISCIGLRKVFIKAGRTGWKAFVPGLNYYHILKIGGISGWLALTIPIPVVNMLVAFWAVYKLGKAFGKDMLFILGMIAFPVAFLPILGFGKSEYVGVGKIPSDSVPMPMPKPKPTTDTTTKIPSPKVTTTTTPIPTTPTTANPTTVTPPSSSKEI